MSNASHDAEQGFSLVDLLMAVTVGSLVMAMSVMATTSAARSIRGDAGMRQVMTQLRQARELAVNQRRTVRVEFLSGYEIRVTRLELPSGETLVSQHFLEGNVRYTRFSTPDTPDAFGGQGAIAFGNAQELNFIADGMLVDEAGVPVSGTVFLGITDQPASARAVTVTGTTGRVRGYRWSGTTWVE